MYRQTSLVAIATIMMAVPGLASENAVPIEVAPATPRTTMQQDEHQPALTMKEAVRLALNSDDPYLLEPGVRASAQQDRAVADSQLPDPKFRATFANWPTNSFSYTQEPMTQLQLGLSQSFPKGDTLKFNRQKRQALAGMEQARLDLRRREIVLDTRQNWLDLYYWTAAREKVLASRTAIAELIEVIEAIYATGRETSQDVFRAELELSLLDDRLVEIDRQDAMVRARLARRIGQDAATKQVTASLPPMRHPSDIAPLTERLSQHPAARVQEANVAVADKDVGVAREQYKPGWSVNVGYGARGADRADLATVGVVMDVPLFTQKRQDKRLSAAKKDRQAAQLGHDTVLLDLKKMLDSSYADWQRLQKRVGLFQSVVIKRAKETSEASLTSYQNGVTDFAELVRARLAELDAELNLLKLQSERMKAQAQLLFLEGEDDA
ncbi:TolC family protein [Kordiimonas lipolytica]|uniref:TolC family protein n=2 Tax=Kordiimonas lipolytica TaxID=1662421 RepID=A0ABV8U5Q5_9PROT